MEWEWGLVWSLNLTIDIALIACIERACLRAGSFWS